MVFTIEYVGMATPSEDLLKYIKDSLATGKTAEVIRAELKAAGWADIDVDTAFGASGPVAPMVSSTAVNKPHKLLLVVVGFIVVAALVMTAVFIFKKKSSPTTQKNDNEKAATLNTPVVEEVTEVELPVDEANEIDDFGLVLPTVNLAANANCYLDENVLKKVVLKSKILPDAEAIIWLKQLSGEDAWNQKLVDDLLEQNAWPISSFKDAMQKPRFQLPLLNDPSKVSVDSMQTVDYSLFKSITTVVALDAISRAKNGDISNGFAEALSVALYGHRMAVSQIDEMGYMVGLGIKQKGLDAFKKILDSGELPLSDVKNAAMFLSSFEDTSPSLATAFKIRYWLKRNDLNYIFNDPAMYYPTTPREKFRDQNFFNLSATINTLGEVTRTSIERTKESCHEFVDEPISQSEIDEVQKMEGENAFGRLYTYQFGRRDALILNRRCADLELVASIRSALAAAEKNLK